MKKEALALAALAAAAPSMASAQDLQGPFVGVQAGWTHDKAKIPTATALDNQDQDSFVGGVFAGYDHRATPNAVLGVEAGFQAGAEDDIAAPGGLYSLRGLMAASCPSNHRTVLRKGWKSSLWRTCRGSPSSTRPTAVKACTGSPEPFRSLGE